MKQVLQITSLLVALCLTVPLAMAQGQVGNEGRGANECPAGLEEGPKIEIDEDVDIGSGSYTTSGEEIGGEITIDEFETKEEDEKEELIGGDWSSSVGKVSRVQVKIGGGKNSVEVGSYDPLTQSGKFSNDADQQGNFNDPDLNKMGGGISNIRFCGASTSCEATTLSEDVDPPENGDPGVVTATFSNTDGIEEIEFTKLENFAVTDSPDNFDKDPNASIWEWDDTGDATDAVFELTQQTTGETSTYFAIASSECSAEDGLLEVNFDPIHELSPEAPAELTFSGNYPNPFRGQTTVEFALPQQADVTLSVYDMMGRKVATLVDGAVGTGFHQVRWGGQGSGGQRLSSGVYLMRLEVGDQTRTDRLTIVR